ncbi:MAG: hypothetical protein AB7U82_16485 [Blastocatellales bacterium]
MTKAAGRVTSKSRGIAVMPNTNKKQIKELIAERVLRLQTDDGVVREIIVRLGKPEPDGQDWACVYQITGFARTCGMRIYGVDAFQALLLAICSLMVDLEAQTTRAGGRLSWLGGDLGFPSPDSILKPPHTVISKSGG